MSHNTQKESLIVAGGDKFSLLCDRERIQLPPNIYTRHDRHGQMTIPWLITDVSSPRSPSAPAVSSLIIAAHPCLLLLLLFLLLSFVWLETSLHSGCQRGDGTGGLIPVKCSQRLFTKEISVMVSSCFKD